MINEDFNVPLIVLVDGIWRPAWGKIIEKKEENRKHLKRWIKFILNGKTFEELEPANWIHFNKETTTGDVQKLAIQCNISDMRYKKK